MPRRSNLETVVPIRWGGAMAPRRISFIIDATLKNVFMVGLSVNRIMAHVAFSELDSHQLETCVVEAVNNVIKHAYRNDAKNQVRVDVTLLEDHVRFDVCDEGIPMESFSVRNLEFDPDDVATLPESGMGLYIIQQIMDQVEYRSEDGVNILTMIRNFSGPPNVL